MGKEATLGQRVVGVGVGETLVEAVKVVGGVPRVSGEQERAVTTPAITLATLEKIH